MQSSLSGKKAAAGFTVVELLVVIAIIAVLAALLVPQLSTYKSYSQRTASLGNLKQIGVAFTLYAGDNNYELPGRPTAPGTSRWPRLLSTYLNDTRVYAAVGDANNYIYRHVDPLSDTQNNTSYIMNGYNDLGAFSDPNVQIRTTGMGQLSQVILLGTPVSTSREYYMDFLGGLHGNQNDTLNLQAYGPGSDYLFGDGSARFIAKATYNNDLWLVDKNYQIPTF